VIARRDSHTGCDGIFVASCKAAHDAHRVALARPAAGAENCDVAHNVIRITVERVTRSCFGALSA